MGRMHERNADDLPVPVDQSTLIPSISNYCDRRCDRCRFRDRCGAYRFIALDDHAPAMIAGHVTSSSLEGTTATVIRSLRHTVRMLRQLADAYGLARDVSREELEEAAHREQAIHDKAIAHPLVESAKQYFFTTMPIVRALRPLSLERGDEGVIEAVDTIEAVAPLVASKVFRAISSLEDEDYDPDDVQSDENGSAKIARIVIADSRAAWQVLMQLGRATADGVPAQLVRQLDEIDAGLAACFPHAMEFVRPGFDTVDADPPTALLTASAGAGDLDA
jgi:hypothetical protein